MKGREVTMADEEKGPEPVEPEEGYELIEEPDKSVALRGWLPEDAQVIDDVIEELQIRAPNKKAIRELFTSSQMYPEAEDLESDLGYIECKPTREVIVNLVVSMMNVADQFSGFIYRDKAPLTTALIGFGLTRIEPLLVRRKERLKKGWEDFCGQKTRFTLEGYSWKVLKATEISDTFHRFKYYVLDPTVRGRINSIKREYKLDLSFIAEMSILEAVRTSRLIPSWAIKELNQEHENFEKWAKMKGFIDTMDIPGELT